jgi:segregation and condensation protein B
MEAAIEAALFVTSEPLRREKLLQVFPQGEQKAAAVALERVVARYRGEPHQGIRVEEVAGGIRLVTRPELHGYLRRLFEVTGQSRLSMAALETLAIVAYRQPITAPEIQELRGVNPSGVLKTLLERRLIRISGRKLIVGRPFLYATTRQFLMHFGLETLEDLPPLEEFEEMLGDLGAVARPAGPVLVHENGPDAEEVPGQEPPTAIPAAVDRGDDGGEGQ